ncbi:MAG TPA: DEAD/DEAH box helicase, partial [Nocardioides sp.]|nr:DEAD/DEAH box helicase [Nocardioides sp.]
DSAGIPMPPEPAMPVEVASPARRPSGRVPVAEIRADGKIWVTAPYEFKDTLKAIGGGKPVKDRGTWSWVYAASPAAAAAIVHALSAAEAQISEKVTTLAEQQANLAVARLVLDQNAPLPVFDTHPLIKSGFTLWDHQIRAVEFASTTLASLLAIPMGGGKTLSTIATVNRTGAKRVMIVCPNKVRGVWPREVRKFSRKSWHIVDGFRESKRARAGRVSLSLTDRLHQAEETLECNCGADVHAVVVNYEAFANDPWNGWIPARKLDLMVYDEIHRLKSYRLKTKTGKRSISGALAQFVNYSERRIGLTGTPMPQTPLDLYGIFRALDPGIFGGSWTLFRSRYAIPNPNLPEMVIGYQNVEELAEKFFSITYRPEIDLKLPAVTDVTRECELEPKAQKVYDSLDKELWADLSSFTGKGVPDLNALDALADAELEEFERDDSTTVTPANIMVKLLRLQQLTGGTVIDDEDNRIRVSSAKAELLEEVLDEVGCVAGQEHEPEPVVVFCRFRSDLDAVREIAERNRLRYAEVSGRHHDGLTRDSEMTPDADVVGVQIQSGGTGVDLTRARVGIWYSLGYSLSDYDQARKRLDRPGQTRPVVFVHLLAKGTADYDVYGALEDRRSVIHGVMAAHGVDAAAAGFKAEAGEPDARTVRGQGAVSLPFERLIEAEQLRVGAPNAAWKRG